MGADDFGPPTDELAEAIRSRIDTAARGEPLPVPAGNRLGRSITCLIRCSPVDGHNAAVVLLMDDARTRSPTWPAAAWTVSAA